uniref:HAT C-terminal dimerisation domain-containing protein n=1 Tax=Setaria italica TaxID=4555 RepID=K4A0K6_SETIT
MRILDGSIKEPIGLRTCRYGERVMDAPLMREKIRRRHGTAAPGAEAERTARSDRKLCSILVSPSLQPCSSLHPTPIFHPNLIIRPARDTMKSKEMRIFRMGEGDFGHSTAINDRQHMLANEWWQTYGCSAPNLQKLALRVLSQTCSASGCERNWSLFEHVHNKKRNKLEHQRLNDIVYVYCNLRLHQSLDEIRKGNEAWTVEDNPPRLNSEELNEFRGEFASLSIQCSDGNVKYLELNLDEVEADAMEENEVMAADDENMFDDLDMALDEDLEASSSAAAEAQDWMPFY